MSDSIKKRISTQEDCSKGGLTRSKNLSPERRREIASNAGRASHGLPPLPKATHSGVLFIAGKEIACDVLEDGRRVLRQATLTKAMGKGKSNAHVAKAASLRGVPIFLSANNLTPYLEDVFVMGPTEIFYKTSDGRKLKGYDASILPEACKVYVKADDDNALQEQQKPIAAVCRTILYGLATVGIIALVDDATGYVEQRNRTELQKILEKYISEELREWTKKFPNEFFKQVYRLHGWEYPRKTNHPQYVGKIINSYVYERLPEGVLDALKSVNPKNENGCRTHRHHQFLSEDVGEENLNKQILKVITLMKVSRSLDEFKDLMERDC